MEPTTDRSGVAKPTTTYRNSAEKASIAATGPDGSEWARKGPGLTGSPSLCYNEGGPPRPMVCLCGCYREEELQVLRKKDRVDYPDEMLMQVLHTLKARGKAVLTFRSSEEARRFRFLLYSWRNLQRATEYQGLEPGLAAVLEQCGIAVDGPHLILQTNPWEWVEEALLDGKPLREWLRQEGKVKGT